MGSNIDLRGVFVPLITPFDSDDRPALAEVEKLAVHALDSGATGLVALGTTGEPATQDADERAAVIEAIATVCRARNAKLIVGAGTNSTKASLVEVEKANAVDGIGAILSVVPYYTRPSEAGIVAHFQTLAAASSVPLVVYNIPYRTGRGLGHTALLELAATENIAGMKQAVGSVDADTLALMAAKPADFHVLTGDDPFIFSHMALGGSGAIAASSHLCTRQFVDMVRLFHEGDIAGARRISGALLPLCEALFMEPSPAILKGALHRLGMISTPELRAPMTAASQAAIDRALEAVTFAESLLSDN